MDVLATGAEVAGILGGLAIFVSAVRWSARRVNALRLEWWETRKAAATVPELTAEVERLQQSLTEMASYQARLDAKTVGLGHDIVDAAREARHGDATLLASLSHTIDLSKDQLNLISQHDEKLRVLAEELGELREALDAAIGEQSEHVQKITQLQKLVDQLKKGFWPPIKAE